MEYLNRCINESNELQELIGSPVFKSKEKTRIFEELFKEAFHPITLSFVRLVLKNRREEYLPGIARYFLDLVKKEQGILSAVLVTAIPLDEHMRQSVMRLVEKKFDVRIDLAEEIDKKLIGGFILRVGDEQIDASIATKINRIKKELIELHF